MKYFLCILILTFLSQQMSAQLTSANENHTFGYWWGSSHTSAYQENEVDLFLPNDPGGDEPWELYQIKISVKKYDQNLRFVGTVSGTLNWSSSKSLGTWYSTSAGSGAQIKVTYVLDEGWAQKYKIRTHETEDFIGLWTYGKPTITAVTRHRVTHQISSLSKEGDLSTFRYNFEPQFPYPTNISVNLYPVSVGGTPGVNGNKPNWTMMGRVYFTVNWDWSESFYESYVPVPHGNPSVSFKWEARGAAYNTVPQGIPQVNTWYKLYRGRDHFLAGHAQSMEGDIWPYMNAPWFENPLRYKMHFKLEWKYNGVWHSTEELNMNVVTGWKNFAEATDNYHFVYTNPGESSDHYFTLKGSYKMGSNQSEHSDQFGFYWGTSDTPNKIIIGTNPVGDLKDHQFEKTLFRPFDDVIFYKAFTEYGDGHEMYGLVKKLVVSSGSGNIDEFKKSAEEDGESFEEITINQGLLKPDEYILNANYPNPFNPSTEIKFGLPKSAYTKLTVYDSQGREVSTLVDEYKESGFHTVQFDGRDLASGIYIYTLITDDFVKAKKMILMK